MSFKEVKKNTFVFEKENALDDEICDRIIKEFQESPYKRPGVSASGRNPLIKNSTDLTTQEGGLEEIDKILYENLNKHLHELGDVCPSFAKYILGSGPIHDKGYQIQWTKQGDLCFVPHCDNTGWNDDNTIGRNLVYLWYLNDVEKGGGTNFPKLGIKVKARKGKLILFPPYWTHEHEGVIPRSGDKYIVTGWLCYERNVKEEQPNVV